MAFKSTAELQRIMDELTDWRPIDPCECALCGQKPAPDVDDDPWLEELALLAEATLL